MNWKQVWQLWNIFQYIYLHITMKNVNIFKLMIMYFVPVVCIFEINICIHSHHIFASCTYFQTFFFFHKLCIHLILWVELVIFLQPVVFTCVKYDCLNDIYEKYNLQFYMDW